MLERSMTTSPLLESLSDDELIAETKRLVAAERVATATFAAVTNRDRRPSPEVSQRTQLVVLVVQRLEGTDRVPTATGIGSCRS